MLAGIVGNKLICCSGTCLFKLIKKASLPVREFCTRTERQDILDSLSPDAHNALRPFLRAKRNTQSNYNFVIDELVARNVAEKVLSDCNVDKTIIIEGNPGLGLITRNIIDSNIPHVVLFDNSKLFECSLINKLQNYQNKVTKLRYNMNISPESTILQTVDFGEKYGLPWKFIGTTTNSHFLRGLILASIKYELWECSMDIYLLIGTRALNELKSSGQLVKFPLYCTFHLLYTLEEIAKYPHTAFLPHSVQREDMNFIYIKTKQNILENMTKEELKEYFPFIFCLGKNKEFFIIPTLEKWLPDCGPHLISKGISMTNQVKDLTPSDSVLLFKVFKECEGYEHFKDLSLYLVTS